MSEVIVQPDDRGRVSLGPREELAGRYRVDRLANGQLLLDPVEMVSSYELRLMREHPGEYAKLLAGVDDVRQGRYGPKL